MGKFQDKQLNEIFLKSCWLPSSSVQTALSCNLFFIHLTASYIYPGIKTDKGLEFGYGLLTHSTMRGIQQSMNDFMQSSHCQAYMNEPCFSVSATS
jgi:hypothetical protein